MDIDKIFSAPEATERQVREHYKAAGYEVRISDGHVRFRSVYRSKTGAWREGRYVSEYRVIDDKVMLV